MDLSSNPSQDQDRIMQRQLYRAGQNQPAPASASPASKPSSSAAAKPKRAPGSSGANQRQPILTPSRRRKALIGLGVAAWLLLLGSISYCLCLPDIEGIAHEFRALRDPNLSPEERREKFKELDSKLSQLSPDQRKQVFQTSFKEMMRKRNKDTFDFFKMSPEDQMAQLKKEAAQRAEWMKRREEMRKARADKGGNNGNRGGGGPRGGWGGGGGPGGGDPGGFLDRSSPEARAGGLYKMRMMEQMGVGPGGRGGRGGGRGGP